MSLIIPPGYKSFLSQKETEHAIVLIKNFFQTTLSTELNLTRVTAPLFVPSGRGLNDDLSGVERPVRFNVGNMNDMQMEVVQSLAKWKRVRVTRLGLQRGFGIYTDMNAIRGDDSIDNIHSIYVDQWDWEQVIDEADRNLDYLKMVVKKIFYCLKRTEFFIYDNYEKISPILPDEVTFIHTEQLEVDYPNLTSKERENAVAKKYGAVFIIGIGYPLKSGESHDMRAPDYDDWITETSNGHGLNGDLLVWNPVLGSALELSSMGIRVSPKTLDAQLEFAKKTERKELLYHRMLLSGELLQTIGGGIGQSRLCMYFLRKAHIGETHASAWPDDMVEECRKNGIFLF